MDRTLQSAVVKAVKDAVETAVESAVESAVDSAVESAVECVVENAVESAVENAVQNAVENAVEKAVEKAIHKAAAQAVDKFYERQRASDVSNKVSKTNEQARKQSTESSLHHEQSHPYPGYKYEIFLGDHNDMRLGVTRHSGLAFVEGHNPLIDQNLVRITWWNCVEADGWLCFQNVSTGKYLGLTDDCCFRGGLYVSANHDNIANDTKFCSRPANRDEKCGYILQSQIGRRLYPIEILDDEDIEVEDVGITSTNARMHA